MRILVGVKRAVDYATKVRVLPDKTGEIKISNYIFLSFLNQEWIWRM